MNLDKNTFFSFGGGVQSTALALFLIYEPERFEDLGLPIPQHVIFADTGAEPDKVIAHVGYIFRLLTSAGYVTTIVKKDKIPIHESDRGLATVPWFTKSLGDKSKGMLPRQCTKEYKIKPIEKEIKAILGAKKYQRIPAQAINLWLGISTDELIRAKNNKTPWIRNLFPLIDLRLNRQDCAIYNYLKLGYQVHKSACFFCPYTNQRVWLERKQTEPELFAKAVKLDEKIRSTSWGKVKKPCFVHPSATPLKEVINQPSFFDFDFDKECSGHCGV